jgi:Calcineurin-like phosphoesterase
MTASNGSWERSSRWIPVVGLALVACGGPDATGPSYDPLTDLPAEIVLAAGNIASCGSSNDEATAAMLDTLPGTIFALGDNAFPDGSALAYANCYAPSWGRHLMRTRAVLGNREYGTGAPTAAFDYFGDRVGPRDLGYYSMTLGNWHVIVLNVSDSVPFVAGSAQSKWLQKDLAANRKRCTLAMWHKPRFFSSNIAGWTDNPSTLALWNQLYDGGVDLVLNGQQHQYERMRPMTPTGATGGGRGIRQFSVGTGGESSEMPLAIAAGSEALSDAFGLLRLTLDDTTYAWEFLPTVAGQFADTGSGTCH